MAEDTKTNTGRLCAKFAGGLVADPAALVEAAGGNVEAGGPGRDRGRPWWLIRIEAGGLVEIEGGRRGLQEIFAARFCELCEMCS